MVAQMRTVLEAHAAGGAPVREEAWAGTGHFLFTQHPQAFADLLGEHLWGGA